MPSSASYASLDKARTAAEEIGAAGYRALGPADTNF